MSKSIDKLYGISHQSSRLIVGLMSGTSFDGLDIALCKIYGSGISTKVEVQHFTTIAYETEFKEALKAIFSRKDADLEKVCLLNAWIGMQHAAMINDSLKKWGVENSSVDLIASHGQTIYHAPRILHRLEEYPNATLQIGDGDHIAVHTGIITLSDFRQKHIAAGGEGAPLAVYGDYLIFSKKGENRIMLNIGGIANFTFLPGDGDPSKLFCSDVGPGNTIMDAFIQQHYPGKYFDAEAQVALQGTVDESLLKALKQHTFFDDPFPKTIGPELFNLKYLKNAQEQSQTQELSNVAVMATLNRFTADMIVHAINQTISIEEPYTIYVSGGGMHNPLLLQHIEIQLKGHSIISTIDLGIHPDAKEAVLFALLANECVAGTVQKIGDKKSGIPTVSFGKISLPD